MARTLFPSVGGMVGTAAGASLGAAAGGIGAAPGGFVGGTTGAAGGESLRQFLSGVTGTPTRNIRETFKHPVRSTLEAFEKPVQQAGIEAAGMGVGAGLSRVAGRAFPTVARMVGGTAEGAAATAAALVGAVKGPKLAVAGARAPFRSKIPMVFQKVGGETAARAKGSEGQGLINLIRGERATLAREAAGETKNIFSRRFSARSTQLQQQKMGAIDEARAQAAESLRRLTMSEQRGTAALAKRQVELESALQNAGMEKVKAIRQKFPSVSKASSDTYRALARRGIEKAKVQLPITRNEFTEGMARRLPDDPQIVDQYANRLFPQQTQSSQLYDAFNNIIQQPPGSQPLPLSEVSKTATAFTRRIKKPALRSARVYTPSEKFADDAISTLVELAEKRGVSEVRQAREFWAKWAPLRDRIFKDFRPFLRDPLEIDQMTKRLLRAAQEAHPRFAERLEEELGVPLFPELRQVLNKLDNVAKAKVAIATRHGLLREQAKLTGQRAEADIETLFSTRGRQLEEAKTITEEFVQKNLDRWLQDIRFKRFLTAPAGFAASLLVWNIVSNAVNAAQIPGVQRFENF